MPNLTALAEMELDGSWAARVLKNTVLRSTNNFAGICLLVSGTDMLIEMLILYFKCIFKNTAIYKKLYYYKKKIYEKYEKKHPCFWTSWSPMNLT